MLANSKAKLAASEVDYLRKVASMGVETKEDLSNFLERQEYKFHTGRHIRENLVKLIKNNFKFYMTQRYSKFVICPLISDNNNVTSSTDFKSASSQSDSSGDFKRRGYQQMVKENNQLASFLVDQIFEMPDFV